MPLHSLKKTTVNDAASVLYRLRNASDDTALCSDLSAVLSTKPHAGAPFFSGKEGAPVAKLGTDLGHPYKLTGSLGTQPLTYNRNPDLGGCVFGRSRAPQRETSQCEADFARGLPEAVPGPATFPQLNWQAGYTALGSQPLSSRHSAAAHAFPLAQTDDVPGVGLFGTAAAHKAGGIFSEKCQHGNGSSIQTRPRALAPRFAPPLMKGRHGDGRGRRPSSPGPGPGAYHLPSCIGQPKWHASPALRPRRRAAAARERQDVHMHLREKERRRFVQSGIVPRPDCWLGRLRGEAVARRTLPASSATIFDNDIDRLERLGIFSKQQLELLASTKTQRQHGKI